MTPRFWIFIPIFLEWHQNIHPRKRIWFFNLVWCSGHAPVVQALLQDGPNATVQSETLRRNCVWCINHKRWCNKTVKKDAKRLRWRWHQTRFILELRVWPSISEGHVLWWRLGILNCQVRSHRPQPWGGHPQGSSKVKQSIFDIRERTMGLCSSNWKNPVHDKWGNILSANLTFSTLPTRTLCCSSFCHAVF